MLVAILDAGFLNSNTNPALSTLFSDKRVVVTYDFVANETSVYEDHSHGNNVFSIMASFKAVSYTHLDVYKRQFSNTSGDNTSAEV